MKLTYFTEADVKDLASLKKAFKKLAFEYHPDRTGKDTNEIMALINKEYGYLFDTLQNGGTYDSANKKDSKNELDKFIEKIQFLAKHQDIVAELIGDWIWVYGNTKPIKDELKENDFKWSGTKKAWYWKDYKYYKLSSKSLSGEEMRAMYGSHVFDLSDKQIKTNSK